MKQILLITISVLAICARCPAQILENLKASLETNHLGRWEIRENTNPSIGPMLVCYPDTTNTWQGFFGILPFPQDNTGREKAEYYMSACAAPMYVLGFTSNITVLTSWKRTNDVCQRVAIALGLSLPDIKSDSDKWINEGILPAPRNMK